MIMLIGLPESSGGMSGIFLCPHHPTSVFSSLFLLEIDAILFAL
jgi:hypothetical protein